MLFHVVAQHSADRCPVTFSGNAGAEELYNHTVGAIASREAAARANVTLLAALVNGPAHRFFLTVEADDQASLNAFLVPLKVMGQCEIDVVSPLSSSLP